MFEAIQMSKLIFTDVITFDTNKTTEDDMKKLTEEIAQFVSMNGISLEPFITDTLKIIGVDEEAKCAFHKLDNKVVVRYDKFKEQKDAMLFKDFMSKLFSRNTYIEEESWQCEKKKIEQLFMMKEL